MKKGFTLIELLAVIVILAIIAAIAVPIVIKVIEETKINSIKSSAKLYLKSAELFISNAELNKIKIPYGTYSIMADGNICIGIIEENKCNGQIIKIEIKGNKPNSGKIIIDKKRIQIDYLEINGYNCYQENTNYNCKKAGNINRETTNGLITIEDSKSTTLSNYRIYGNIEEYQAVEYIESTGTQYIDTEYNFNSNTSILFDYQLTDTTQSGKGVFGTYEGTSQRYETIIRSNGMDYAGEFEFGYYTQYEKTLGVKQDTARHQIFQDKNLLYFDNILIKTFALGDFAQSISAYLLNYNHNGTSKDPLLARLYGCKIYDNDILVRDFIPCYRKSDGEVGLFDLVNNKFYGNNGTGIFNKGQAVTIDEVLVENVGNHNIKIGKYEIPIKVIGKNLFDVDDYIIDRNGAVGISTDNLQIGETYTVSSLSPFNWFKISNDSQGYNSILKQDSSGLLNFTFIMKKNENLLPKQKQYIIMKFGSTSASNDINEFKQAKVQIEKGTKGTSYEPYKEEGYKIELDEPLRCLEEVCDYVDFARGKVVRNVEIVNSELIKLEKSYLEDIELPEININKGVTNIFIETQVKPRNFVVEYNN